MRNIIHIGAGTDRRNRFVAIALGVALAVGPAAMLPAAALAAPATDAAAASTTAGATITLQGADGASLAGHTFDVYRIGTYTDQILNGTQISSLGVRGDTASNAWAADATPVEMTRVTSNGHGDKVGGKSTTITTKVSNTDPRDHGSQWETYEGYYQVPEGQKNTVFMFKSLEGFKDVETLPGNNVGNLVDDIEFSRSYKLTYDKNASDATGKVPSNQRGKENTVQPAKSKTTGSVGLAADKTVSGLTVHDLKKNDKGKVSSSSKADSTQPAAFKAPGAKVETIASRAAGDELAVNGGFDTPKWSIAKEGQGLPWVYVKPNAGTIRSYAQAMAGQTGVVLLGGMAGLSGTAMAAGAGTITLTAPAGETLANHSFSAYKIGDYSGYADANANGKIDGTNVTNAAGTQAWLKAALTKAGLGVDSAKGLDEAGTLAATTQAAKLSTVANALADAANKPGAVVADKTSNTGSLTLNVPGEGLYLVVDSDGLPIIVGTKINGKDLEKQALGTAVIKSTSISVDKEGSGDTTIGKTVSYTATFKIPQKNANPTKLSYTDQPTNLAIVRNSLKIKVDNQAAVAVPSEAITWNRDGGFTLTGDSYLSDATYGKTVVISYDATVTGKDPHNTGTVKATLDGKDKTTSDDVTLANFDFDLAKVKADGRTAVKDAGFVIKNQAGKYMKLDAASGKWSDVDVKDAAAAKAAGAERLTDAQGHLAFDGLGDGTYTVEESTVPSGYLPTPASFTVTIKNGKASVKGTGLNAGLTGGNANLAEDGAVTVKNLDSISQLAQTGATGVTITVAMAGLLALGAGGAWTLRRRTVQSAE